MAPSFEQPAEALARALIGVTLLFHDVGGEIVETEAYDAGDPASHSFAGPRQRNATMFGPPGHAYVYRIYGLHHCLNVTCGAGAAVLIRALAPTHGVAAMRTRRGMDDLSRLCSGPGRLCAALGIDLSVDGTDLRAPSFTWVERRGDPPIAAGRRIGISRAVDRPWRFGLVDSPFLSRPISSDDTVPAPQLRSGAVPGVSDR
jgi:DNA-3-methyladenine glycosylase